MSVRIVRTGVFILALILVGASFVQAAPSSSVQVKFKFIVAGKMLEPGTYGVEVADGGKVVLTSDKGGTVELSQIRDLGHKKVSRTELVFEEMGSLMYLSEVWTPDKAGVKVGGADGAERRVTVAAKTDK
jgi:hypothetical protein